MGSRKKQLSLSKLNPEYLGDPGSFSAIPYIVDALERSRKSAIGGDGAGESFPAGVADAEKAR